MPQCTKLKVSKNSFDFAWISAIEEPGRHDWYEPLRRQFRTKIRDCSAFVDLFCRRCWHHKENPQHRFIPPNNLTRLGSVILHEKLKYCWESVGAWDH